MCDSFWPVGRVSTTAFVRGSTTLMELVPSAVTYSRPSGPNTAPCGRSGAPKSIVATRRREAMSITSIVRPSEPGRPTPASP